MIPSEHIETEFILNKKLGTFKLNRKATPKNRPRIRMEENELAIKDGLESLKVGNIDF